MYTLTTFQEEKLKEFLPSWCDIMSDRNIPQYVRGVNFHLWEGFPLARELRNSQPSVFSAQQHHILELEIQTILEKEVIKESGTGPGEFIFF